MRSGKGGLRVCGTWGIARWTEGPRKSGIKGYEKMGRICFNGFNQLYSILYLIGISHKNRNPQITPLRCQGKGR